MKLRIVEIAPGVSQNRGSITFSEMKFITPRTVAHSLPSLIASGKTLLSFVSIVINGIHTFEIKVKLIVDLSTWIVASQLGRIYCMAVSVIGAPFMLYLGLLCLVKSQTLYIKPESYTITTISLLIAAAFYAGLYYFLSISKKQQKTHGQQLERWVSETRYKNNFQKSQDIQMQQKL